MLVIKPIQEENEKNVICSLCGIEDVNENFCYKAFNDGELLGCAVFEIYGTNAELMYLKQKVGTDEDFEGMFILSRAVFNFLDLCGVKFVSYTPSTDFEIRLAKSLGFKGEHQMSVSLEGMFDSKCGGCCDG